VSTTSDRGLLSFVTDAWPVLALGVVGALIIRACVPAHPAAPPPASAGLAAPAAATAAAPAFDAQAAARINNSQAAAALGAMTPDSSPAQLVDALNLLVIDFGQGSSALPQGVDPILTQVATVLEARSPSERYEVSAHTDGSGTPLSDLELSRRRAQAVIDFLVNQGVPGERLQARGAGDLDPAAGESNEESRLRSRHLEFAVLP
jgi:outer membrane protein OmpA-like peptidoglycan-associated protein